MFLSGVRQKKLLWVIDCGLFTNFPRIIVVCDFSPSSFKLKRYPTSLEKISNLTRQLLVISRHHFSCELDSWRTYSLQNISYLSAPLQRIVQSDWTKAYSNHKMYVLNWGKTLLFHSKSINFSSQIIFYLTIPFGPTKNKNDKSSQAWVWLATRGHT